MVERRDRLLDDGGRLWPRAIRSRLCEDEGRQPEGCPWLGAGDADGLRVGLEG